MTKKNKGIKAQIEENNAPYYEDVSIERLTEIVDELISKASGNEKPNSTRK